MSALPPLPAPLSKALADKGFDTLTAVQEAMLDPALAGADLLVSAQTGSGKTVAFGLAMAGSLLDDTDMLPPPATALALVIAPTRELALQVRREFEWLYADAHAAIASCVGGMDARTERRALERGAHIVVGTPGRLRDHTERNSLDLSTVRAVVLDEADEMLDLGFREDLEFILQALPAERRTLMFSATLSPEIERLARTYQRDARRVATEARREAHGDIAYRALVVAGNDAENAIVNVLRYYEARNALVFCKTRAAVNHLTARFLNRGFPVVPLSGELAQEERTRALQAMRDGRARVCVATDVAARGIDLPGLDLVIHADLPTNTETLLHRSGRTGRAGRKGVCVLVVPSSARRRTERLLQQANVVAEWAGAPTAAEVSARDTERLLTDPALGAPELPDEASVVTLLAERFTSRELAAAVARQFFAARSAPEDITPIHPDAPPPPRARAEFDRSFWVRIEAGYQQRAEARWLLPMLCRTGNLTKTDIGAIKIFDGHTLAQIHADASERFFAAMGEAMVLDTGIAVSRAEAPSAEASATRPEIPRAPRAEGDSPRPFKPRAPRAEGDAPRPYKPRAEGDSEHAYKPRPPRPEGDAPRPYAPRTEGDAPKPYKPRTPRPDGEAPRTYTPRAAAERPYTPRTEGDAPKPYKPRTPRTEGEAPRPYGPRAAGERPYTPRNEGDAPKPYKPRTPRPDGEAPKPYKPRAAVGERPYTARSEGDAPKPYKPRTARADGDAPRPFKPSGAGDRPFTPRTDGDAPKPYKPRTPRPEGDAPRPFKPRAAGDRPYTPRGDGEPPKPYKPRTEGDAPRPFKPRTATGAPDRPRFDPAAARDPSARLGPSGKPRKPGSKPGGKPGGDSRPSRPKR